MIGVDPYLLLLLVASLFILVFGLLGIVRREGLSIQFVVEAALLTAILVGGSWLLGIQLNPFLFLAILYLVTMRSRLIVDLANLLVQRDQQALAFRLYDLGLAWWPDTASSLIVQANRGAAELQSGRVAQAISTLEQVLSGEEHPQLGLKYEAACRYNLGYAYEKAGEERQAVAQYRETIELLPGSLYAKAAQAALKRHKNRQEQGTES
jgi:tetratricopeptide (TPR) repeat protein